MFFSVLRKISFIHWIIYKKTRKEIFKKPEMFWKHGFFSNFAAKSTKTMKHFILILSIMMLSLSTGCAQKRTAAPAAKSVTTQVAAGVQLVNNPAQTDAKGILQAIKAPYKGKVVLIDFWATWCGPCMMAMKQIDPIKEKYLEAKKNVVFVYITGETSPLQDFNKAIPGIKGYHYRLSKAQFNTLLQDLGIRGIPTYMVINKDGSVAYDNIATGGYPGDDVITEQIDHALTK